MHREGTAQLPKGDSHMKTTFVVLCALLLACVPETLPNNAGVAFAVEAYCKEGGPRHALSRRHRENLRQHIIARVNEASADEQALLVGVRAETIIERRSCN